MKRFLLLAITFVFLGLNYANADTIISTTDQGVLGLWNAGSCVGQAFTTGSGVTINSAMFKYDYGSYAPSESAQLEIMSADEDGKIDFFDSLATWDAFSTSSGNVTFSGSYTMDANTTYWLVLSDGSSNTYARVAGGTSYDGYYGASLPSTYCSYDDEGYWSLADNPLWFEVEGTVVPIPPAALLLASGLLGLIGIMRFRGRG